MSIAKWQEKEQKKLKTRPRCSLSPSLKKSKGNIYSHSLCNRRCFVGPPARLSCCLAILVALSGRCSQYVEGLISSTSFSVFLFSLAILVFFCKIQRAKLYLPAAERVCRKNKCLKNETNLRLCASVHDAFSECATKSFTDTFVYSLAKRQH